MLKWRARPSWDSLSKEYVYQRKVQRPRKLTVNNRGGFVTVCVWLLHGRKYAKTVIRSDVTETCPFRMSGTDDSYSGYRFGRARKQSRRLSGNPVRTCYGEFLFVFFFKYLLDGLTGRFERKRLQSTVGFRSVRTRDNIGPVIRSVRSNVDERAIRKISGSRDSQPKTNARAPKRPTCRRRVFRITHSPHVRRHNSPTGLRLYLANWILPRSSAPPCPAEIHWPVSFAKHGSFVNRTDVLCRPISFAHTFKHLYLSENYEHNGYTYGYGRRSRRIHDSFAYWRR